MGFRFWCALGINPCLDERYSNRSDDSLTEITVVLDSQNLAALKEIINYF